MPKLLTAVLLAPVVVFAGWIDKAGESLPDSASVVFSVTAAEAGKQLPDDVGAFVERRRICDHFRGEEPYSPERRAEINRATEQYCRGTDRDLALLKSKHRGNAAVAALLETFEPSIEARE